jgi:hypothetical protein
MGWAGELKTKKYTGAQSSHSQVRVPRGRQAEQALLEREQLIAKLAFGGQIVEAKDTLDARVADDFEHELGPYTRPK